MPEIVVLALLPRLNISVALFFFSFTQYFRLSSLSGCSPFPHGEATHSLFRASRPRKAPGSTVLIKLFLRSLEKRNRKKKESNTTVRPFITILSIYTCTYLSISLSFHWYGIKWCFVLRRNPHWAHPCWPWCRDVNACFSKGNAILSKRAWGYIFIQFTEQWFVSS